MNLMYFQCCFSNIERATGEGTSSGWDTLAVSDNLPQEAYVTCRHLQSKNNEELNRLSDEAIACGQWEIQCENDYLFYNHTRYGLTDYHGRPNLFSHALIFPRASSLLKSPNSFLSLSLSTFANGEEELDTETDLVFEDSFTFDSAVQICQISVANIKKLIESVYERLISEMIFEPLYIECDNDSEKRALLYIIYTCLPISFRRLLTVSSIKTPKTTTKLLVFDRDAQKERYYCDVRTGVTTILDEDELDFNGKDYLSYPLSLNEQDRKDYFLLFNQKYEDLKLSETIDEAALRFVHLLCLSPMQNELTMIKECLRIRKRSQKLDELLVKFLKNIINNGEVLNEYDENFLSICSTKTTLPELKKIATIYFTNALLRLDKDEALAKLNEKSKEELKESASELTKSEYGKELYTTVLKNKMTQTSIDSLEKLKLLLNDIETYPQFELLEKEIIQIGKNLYEKEILKGDKVKLYHDYVNLINIFSSDHQLILEAQESLLDAVDLEDFDNQKEIKQILEIIEVNSDKKQFYSRIYDLIEELKQEENIVCKWICMRDFINEERSSFVETQQLKEVILNNIAISDEDKNWFSSLDTIDCEEQELYRLNDLRTTMLKLNFQEFNDLLHTRHENLSYSESLSNLNNSSRPQHLENTSNSKYHTRTKDSLRANRLSRSERTLNSESLRNSNNLSRTQHIENTSNSEYHTRAKDSLRANRLSRSDHTLNSENLRNSNSSSRPQHLENTSNSADLPRKGFKALLDELSRKDKEVVVPLDFWLILGKHSKQKWIIDDQLEPRILREDIDIILKNSQLVKEEEYQDRLSDYSKNRKHYSKIIGKVVKKAHKRYLHSEKTPFLKKLWFTSKGKEE